jgi:hypothetical protein
MSSPAFKISDELVAQHRLGAVACVFHEAVGLCGNPDQLHETTRPTWLRARCVERTARPHGDGRISNELGAQEKF